MDNLIFMEVTVETTNIKCMILISSIKYIKPYDNNTKSMIVLLDGTNVIANQTYSEIDAVVTKVQPGVLLS